MASSPPSPPLRRRTAPSTKRALRDHVDFLIDNGLHGLVPGGSTGEFAALTLDERKLVNTVVIDQAAGRVPVAPQTGSTRTAEAIELSRHAADAGADAVLLVQPFYEAPTRHEVIEYFATVGEAAEHPGHRVQPARCHRE